MYATAKQKLINQPHFYPPDPIQSSNKKDGLVGLILACLFFFIPLCSLPPARIGYFSQVETSVFAFWMLSAFSYVWLHSLWKKNPRLVIHCSQLPIVWGPILLGLVTILLSLLHPLPLRDFTGSGQIGEGALTFIASGMMACHFSIMTRIALCRKIIFATAFFAGILISILTIIGSMDSPFISWRYWSWAAFFFPDFLAFIDIALMAIYCYTRQELKDKQYLYDIIALSLFAFIGYFANNKSLIYGLVIAGLSTFGIWLFPKSWRRNLLELAFFGLTLSLTLLIIFYDDFSNFLPDSLKSLGHLSTITSRTWLSKVTLVDLWLTPINEQWIQQVMMGSGWGSFSNISAANMFLIDHVSLFAGKEYQPSWELVSRDLLHTHNVLTNIFHSIGLIGVTLYLYTQHKIIRSISSTTFWLGTAFLIAYQLQVLFWFQFLMTIPFTLLTMALLFRKRSMVTWSSLLSPKILLVYPCLLFIFSGLQGYIMLGYKQNFVQKESRSITELVQLFTTSPYGSVESTIGAQRQVGLARIYSLALQKDFENSPEKLTMHSLKLVNHLHRLPKNGNYLANNVALNILSELASKSETLKYFNKDTYKLWEELANDHVKLMPYRSDILLPFFNLYQTMSKDHIVMELAHAILEQYPNDAIALWFIGSSKLKNSTQFEEGMCMLKKSIHKGVARLMPIPQPLRTKIMNYAQACP